MSKVIWKSGTFLYPLPVVMVSCGTMEKSNIITVAWTGIINTDKPMCYISIRKERYSHDIIKQSKEFVINLTNQDLVYATDWCGVKTGAKVDKFKEMKLTKQEAKFVKCPLIKESPVSIECKVKEIKELGSHDMFLAEIVSIDAEESYIDEKGAFDITKCNLVAYANGRYFALGKQIGKFGYSVQKKDKLKQNSKKKKRKVKENSEKSKIKKTRQVAKGNSKNPSKSMAIKNSKTTRKRKEIKQRITRTKKQNRKTK